MDGTERMTETMAGEKVGESGGGAVRLHSP